MTFLTKNTPVFFFLFIVVCFSSPISAQEITISNKETKEPIVEVAVYNEAQSKSVISDFYGKINLNIFTETEVIYFKHIGYKFLAIKKKDIKKGQVFLETKAEGLDEIVISASKFEENKRDVPKKIVSISANTIEFNNPQTSADLLEASGQVYIQKSQLGGGSPMIRGFSTNRLLITVDGVRMNNAIFRGGNIQNVISIDPFSIQNTEVSLGAGNVIYGSDAIGGVMSFYTHKPQVSYTEAKFVKAEAVLRHATASNEKTGHLGFNYGIKKWAFISNATYTSFDDLRMGSHGPKDYLRPEFVVTHNGEDAIVKNSNPLVQKFSGYNQMNLMQKVRYESKENLTFDLGVFYTTTSDNPRYDRLLRYRNGTLRSAEWYYGPQTWFMTNFNVTKLSSHSNLYDKIQATAAYQNFQESRTDRNFQSAIRNTRAETVNALSFNLDLEKRLSRRTNLFYGFEYVYNKVNSEAFQENIELFEIQPIVTRYPNGSSWQSAAVYGNIKYKPNDHVVFQTGLRYNYVLSHADFSENNVFLNLPFRASTNRASALTGSAGVSWSPNSIMQWRLNASSAFRAPNIDDIGKVFDSEPGVVVVPNESLMAEYAYGGELGLKLNFDGIVIFDTATYYTYLNNALVRRHGDLNGETEIFYDGELSAVQSIQNASKSWIYGFEIGAQINFNDTVKLTSQYNITGGTEETDGIEVPVRHVAPNFGNTHLVWQNKWLKVDGYLNYNNALDFNQFAPSEKEKDYLYALDQNGNPHSPSWYTLNLRTQYQINRATTLTTSLENITDQGYRAYSSGISSPGRNLIVSIKYNL